MPKKKDIVQELIEKNRELEMKLLHASEWMQKNVSESQDAIEDEVEEIHVWDIKKKITLFLWDFPIWQDEENIVDDLISSEILFHHLQRDPNLDGTGIIIWYNKVLDFLIEKCITSPFRQYAHSRCENIIKSSNHIEKNLHLTIHKWYMLSVGRLYEVLENIKNNYQKGFYLELFERFLEEYGYIKDTLFNEHFYKNLEILVDKEMFWSKRHSGSVSLEEAQEVRRIIAGNLENPDCILIQLLTLGETP